MIHVSIQITKYIILMLFDVVFHKDQYAKKICKQKTFLHDKLDLNVSNETTIVLLSIGTLIFEIAEELRYLQQI